MPQRKIFDLEFAFAGREGSVASTAGDSTINDLRPSFGFDDPIKCIAMWAIEMKRRIFGHGTPDPFSPKFTIASRRRRGIVKINSAP